MEPEKEDSTVTPIIINTSHVDKSDIYDAWRSTIIPLFNASPVKKALPSENTFVEACSIDNCVMMHSYFDASLFLRDKKRIAHYDNDCVMLCLWLDGDNMVENSGIYTHIKKRGAFIVDMGKTIESISSNSEVLVAIFPKPMLQQFGINTNKLSGICIPGEDPRFEILRSTYMTTFKSSSKIKSKHAPQISRGLIALLASLIDDSNRTPEVSETLRHSIRSSMVEYIEKNIADPRLGVKMLLRAFPVSRSTLYTLFEPLGGVAQYIRERRLHQCYKLLSHPSHTNTKIKLIAESFGFSNSSHFCKLFKNHYNLTPGDIQDATRSHFFQPSDIKEALQKDKKIELINNWLLYSNTYLRA